MSRRALRKAISACSAHLPSICAIAAILICPQTVELLAQTNTAEIQGVIRDSTGGMLPGASVIVVSATSGLRIERVSDDMGRFFVPGLPVGEYSSSANIDV